MKTIELEIGETDRISLVSHAGPNGFVWMVAHLPDHVYLADIDDEAPSRPLPGKPGTRWFTIVGVRPGRGRLVFVLVRPWEILRPAQQISYEVVVESEQVAVPIGIPNGEPTGGPIPLYGSMLTEARERGDLAEMKALATHARVTLAEQGELAKALEQLEAEIAETEARDPP
jgi:hypothetical protein